MFASPPAGRCLRLLPSAQRLSAIGRRCTALAAPAVAWLQNAVVFQSYGAAARHLTGGREAQPLSLAHVFWAGCFAGVVQTVSARRLPLLGAA
jgi:hypothetical protein